LLRLPRGSGSFPMLPSSARMLSSGSGTAGGGICLARRFPGRRLSAAGEQAPLVMERHHMVRILLTGNSPDIPRISSLLSRWGMMVQDHTGQLLSSANMTHEKCDLVLMACSAESGQPVCPQMDALQGDAAPILLLGDVPENCACRAHCSRCIPENHWKDEALSDALDGCLASTETWHNTAGDLQGFCDYLQFLNHEMRSPLTAAHNALQILAHELDAVDDPRYRFVRIALRNMRRLCTTMDWNENYLETQARLSTPRWRWHDPAHLISEAYGDDCPCVLKLGITPEVSAQQMLSDEELLRALLQQVLRALHYHAQGSTITLEVRVRECTATMQSMTGTSGGDLVLSFGLERGGSQTPEIGAVARTRLVACDDGPSADLDGLLDFTISRELTRRLGVDLRRPVDGRDGMLLELILPLVPAGADLSCIDAT